ncbi:alpha/beta fold hydrolase [Pedobacter alpinus]|uniref:Alpha/beta fold hydrolase n=1 Tax=Pedobacter alpinus TaxID=1590643 RepID=A0ABW5TR16_9SPHI
MKKITLIIILSVIAFNSKAQNILQNINLASEFFIQLDSGNYDKAYSLFDASMTEKVKPENLKVLWTQITSKLGKFEGIDGATNKSQGDLQLVILEGGFKNDTQPFQFAFNKESKIVGFFILPKNPESTYKYPSYADPNSFTEKLITINTGKHNLPAMLTLPKDSLNCPIVILVHGSGPSDMDETIGPNKPFKDIAVGLASKGIASIRYVKSTMLFANEFVGAFTVKEEVINDALTVIDYAKTVQQIDSTKIYVFGHSLGGMLAPRIASLKPTEIKGLILAAAPARKLQDLAIEQNNYFFKLQKDTAKTAPLAFAKAIKDLNFTKTLNAKTPQQDSLYLGLPVSYWADLNTMDQVVIAKTLKQRMLIIQGGNDFQVSTTDLKLWQEALKGKKNVDTKLYPMLNHLFAFVPEKGDNNQYLKPINVDQPLIEDLASWILQK